MVKRTVEELKTYETPGHFGCMAICIHGREETGVAEFQIGISTFLPGDGVKYAYESNPLEKVYYVLEGEVMVEDNEGGIYVIHKDESISFKLSEGRCLKNGSNPPVRMLIIVDYPKT